MNSEGKYRLQEEKSALALSLPDKERAVLLFSGFWGSLLGSLDRPEQENKLPVAPDIPILRD